MNPSWPIAFSSPLFFLICAEIGLPACFLYRSLPRRKDETHPPDFLRARAFICFVTIAGLSVSVAAKVIKVLGEGTGRLLEVSSPEEDHLFKYLVSPFPVGICLSSDPLRGRCALLLPPLLHHPRKRFSRGPRAFGQYIEVPMSVPKMPLTGDDILVPYHDSA